MGTNENIYKQIIGRNLTDRDGLAMSEMVGDFTYQNVGPTYLWRSTPIDRLWVTSDVPVVGA